MASGFNISTFKSRGLTGGGARPSLFEVYLTIPAFAGATTGSDTKFRFTCQAASLPASTIATVEVQTEVLEENEKETKEKIRKEKQAERKKPETVNFN